MNINDLTIGQVLDIKRLFSGDDAEHTNTASKTSIVDGAIGKYVIVRSRSEGVNAGFLEAADETGCVLKEVRRLWYYKPLDNNTSWYEGVADSGLHEISKISCSVSNKYIMEDYSITVCTDVSQKSIRGFKAHESN